MPDLILDLVPIPVLARIRLLVLAIPETLAVQEIPAARTQEIPQAHRVQTQEQAAHRAHRARARLHRVRIQGLRVEMQEQIVVLVSMEQVARHLIRCQIM